MNKTKNRFHEPVLAFALSACIFLVVCMLRGIAPFGDKTFLQIDLFHQYAPFHAELRERLLAGKSLIYSWEGGLGKEFIVQAAYYTCSPLSLLVLLFPPKLLPQFIHLLMILKISLAAASFCYYLKQSFRGEGIMTVAFALFYAWCGFVACYYWNIMWLDAVALFPLLALGIERLVKENRWHLYVGVLALTVLVNFYIAFLVCICSVLYFLLILWTTYQWKEQKNEILGCCIRFGVFSILAGCSIMFLIFPTARALSQTATSETQFPSFSLYQNLFQLTSAYLPGARPVVLGKNDDLPNLYSGLLTVLLCGVYFLNGNIRKREKLGYGILLIFLLACCCIQPLDFAIHGGHFPANLPHRFVFVYSFLLIRMAYTAWQERADISSGKWILLAAVLVAGVAIPEFVIVPKLYRLDRVYSNQDLQFAIVLLMAYLALYIGYVQRWKYARAVPYLLLGLAIAECLFNGYQSMNRSTKLDSYVAYMDAADDVFADLNEKEQGNFYRSEFRRFNSVNDGALYHYAGVSQFSSLAPGGISDMLKGLGVAATGNSYRYYDPTPLIDGILGVKYVLNKDSAGDATSVKEHYDFLEQKDNLWVYENRTALPLGFLVDAAMKEWDPTKGTPFAVQDQWLSCSGAASDTMFREMDWASFNVENMNITSNETNGFAYRLTEPQNLDAIPKVNIFYTSDQHQYLYLYADIENAKRFVYATGKERQDRELSVGNGMIDVGWVEPGETIQITAELTDKGEFEKFYHESGNVRVYAAGYNQQAWQQAYEQLSQSPWKLDSWSDTKLDGTVHAENDSVLFTSIPYAKGWKAMVDGKAQEIIPLGGGVIGLDIPSGDHQITLSFTAPGLVAGICVSVAAWLMLGALVVTEKKRRNI